MEQPKRFLPASKHHRKSKTAKLSKSITTRSYPLTNPDRILYPEQNITKLDLASYYSLVHQWMLPYVINRPLTLVRCPSGIQKECFYQKHVSEEVPGLYRISIQESLKTGSYTFIKNLQGLLALVQLGVLEIHPWGSRVDNVEKPDMFILDLDPAPGIKWNKVVQAAHQIRERLHDLNLVSFVKTTGGKGLHVVVPIKRNYSWEEVKKFTQAFVIALVQQNPKQYVGVMTKSKREGKIFVDYLRNQRGATAIALYSARAREEAPVAVPLRWEELTTRIKSDSYTIKNLSQRLKKLSDDPWEGFFKLKQAIIVS